MLRRTLNLGILAHVDAGKTTLTERLLYAAGVIDELGSVDAGTTQTDSLALEQQRGITIKSAVASFALEDARINLIDTPGHPDFIAEVERVLGVLDGAVLVISAVEGVQPQTRILIRALQRIGVPTVIFVNKIDRKGARYESVLGEIAERLSPSVVAMGSISGAGTRGADFLPFGARDERFVERLAEVLAERDESILRAYLDGGVRSSHKRCRRDLAVQTRRVQVHPVYFGSALTGAGIGELTGGLMLLVPRSTARVEGAPSGRVFKIERDAAGAKVAFARLFSGGLGARDHVRVGGRPERKVTAVSVLDHGSAFVPGRGLPGNIVKLWGLPEVQVGDPIGEAGALSGGHQFAPPTLEALVVPVESADRGALRVALGQLAEQDPLVDVRLDDLSSECRISLYGEMQKEIIGSTLAMEYGLEVSFRDTTTICIERPLAGGSSLERLREPQNPFLATVGLRVEPSAPGSRVEFRRAVEVHGTMPIAFFRAVEDTVRRTLRQGLHGWEVTDCVVTLTHTGYYPRQSHSHQGFSKSMSSTGEDFRGLTPLVLMTALRRAGTVVCEPIHRFRIDVPAEELGQLLPVLHRVGASVNEQTVVGSSCVVLGDIAASQVHVLRLQLPGLTRGEGVFESDFDRYEPFSGAAPPARPRAGDNPLDRKEYLLRVLRRSGGPPDR